VPYGIERHRSAIDDVAAARHLKIDKHHPPRNTVAGSSMFAVDLLICMQR
jgi:hypothetical protein